MDDAERLRALVAEALEEMELHGSTALEPVCARHPELADRIRRRVRLLQNFGLTSGEETATPGTLGEFRLLSRLGGGAMGVVYLAEQETLQRRVALKLIRPDQLPFDQSRARFRREALATGRLHHPHIIPLYEVGEHEGVPYLAMEYVEGRSLAQVLDAVRDRPLDTLSGADFLAGPGAGETAGLRVLSWVDACLTLVREVALALEHAHRRGVVHRDVKPSNILVSRDGSSRVVDFGLAVASGTDELTRSGTLLGSLPYLAPEVIREGAARADAASDVYSLGVTLYELLTLRCPYLENDSEITRQKILAARPARPRALHAGLSWDAETVCLTAMEPDRGPRYATAGALAEDLERVLQRLPIRARPPGTWRRLRRFVERNPGWALSIGMAALLLLAVAGFTSVLAYRNYDFLQKERRLGADLKAALERETAALHQVEENWQRSERSLGKAREAVLRFLTFVADEKLEGYPETEELRRELLADAVRFSEEFRAISGDAPEDLHGLAFNFRLLGDRQSSLGEVLASLQAYRNAVDILEPLVEEFPENRRYRNDLALSWYELGSAKGLARQPEESIAALERALAHAERLAEGGSPDALNQLTLIQGALALPLDQQGRYEEALEVTEHALHRFEELRRLRPSDPTLDLRSCTAQVNRLRFLANLSRTEEAEQAAVELFPYVEELRRRDPRDPRLEQAQALAHSCLGQAFQRGKQWERAEEEKLVALDLHRGLASRFPEQWYHGIHLSIENVALADIDRDAGWLDDALGFAREGVEEAEKALEQFPEVPQVRQQVWAARSMLAEVLRDAGLEDEARELCALLAAEMQATEDLAGNPDLARYFVERSLDLARVPGEGAEHLRAALDVALPWFENTADWVIQDWRPKITRRLLDAAFLLGDGDSYDALVASLRAPPLKPGRGEALLALAQEHRSRSADAAWRVRAEALAAALEE